MTLKTVLLINDFASVNGGASQVAIQTALGLAQRGLRVIYFCAVPPEDAALRAAENIEVVLTGQHEILTDPNRLRAVLQGVWNPVSRRAMLRLLAALDARETIVHVHGWTKALSSSPVQAALKGGFPVVLTLHDYFTACPNGGFYNYPRQAVCPLRGLSAACFFTNCDPRSYPQKVWRFARGVAQRLGGIPDGIRHFISLSDLSENVLRPYLPAQAHIYRLPNPVTVQRAPRVMAENNTTAVMVGRLAPEKGVLQAAQAAAEAGMALEFIGDGPLKEQILQAAPQAVITGWLPAEAVADRMQKARVLLFCSQLYETQGLVVREAAAHGVPAIVSAGSAAAEWVKPGQTGWQYQTGARGDLAAKIRAAQDDRQIAAFSQNVYDQYWAAPESPERVMERLLEVYAVISG